MVIRVGPRKGGERKYRILPPAAFASAWFLAEHRCHYGESESEQKYARWHDCGVGEEKYGERRELCGLC